MVKGVKAGQAEIKATSQDGDCCVESSSVCFRWQMTDVEWRDDLWLLRNWKQ